MVLFLIYKKLQLHCSVELIAIPNSNFYFLFASTKSLQLFRKARLSTTISSSLEYTKTGFNTEFRIASAQSSRFRDSVFRDRAERSISLSPSSIFVSADLRDLETLRKNRSPFQPPSRSACTREHVEKYRERAIGRTEVDVDSRSCRPRIIDLQPGESRDIRMQQLTRVSGPNLPPPSQPLFTFAQSLITHAPARPTLA